MKIKAKILFLLFFVFSNNNYAQVCSCCSACGATCFSIDNQSYNDSLSQQNPVNIDVWNDYRFYKQVDYSGSTVIKNADISSVSIRYYIRKGFAVQAMAPFIYSQTTVNSSSGFGDATFIVNKRFSIKQLQFNALAGMEFPTGKSQNYTRENGVDVLSFVSGSGSYDPVIGLSADKKINSLIIRANTFYKITTKGNRDIYFGDFMKVGLALYKSLLSDRKKSKVNLTAGINYEELKKQKQYGIYLQKTGYKAFVANAGVILGFKQISFPFVVEKPFLQQLNGNPAKNYLRIKTGLLINF